MFSANNRLGLHSLQRGVALLTVLFVLVLLTTLAVYIAEDEHLAIRKLENQRDAEQSRQVALGGEVWVAKALEQDANRRSGTACSSGTACLMDSWATIAGSTIALEDGTMQVTAYDESGKFNLNNLVDGREIRDPSATATSTDPLISPWYSLFQRLLISQGIEEEKVDLVVDWIDANDEASLSGAESSAYLSSDNGPYLAPNHPMSSISELNFIDGFTDAEIKKLAPLVTALPVTPGLINGDSQFPDLSGDLIKINISTAGPEILSVLQEATLESYTLEAIKADQKAGLYSTVSSALHNFDANEREQVEALIDVKSNYFSVTSCAKYGRVTYSLKSILERTQDTQNPKISVLSRQRTYRCELTTETQ
ncbi:MAG: general secretion pathway protein K [Saprospiraceae bacterium]|jgi:general secretion pathway protein K